MAQTLLITGFPNSGTMSIGQIAEAATDTIAIGTATVFTETAVLGYFESSAIVVTAGWYRGIDDGGQPWWFNVPASGRAIGQKDLPNTATVGTATSVALSAASIQAIWDALTAAMTTSGSIGKKLTDWVIGTTQTADVATVLTRLGTPSDLGSGATVAANLIDIESQTDDIGAAGAGLTAVASAANLQLVDDLVDELESRLTALRAGYLDNLNIGGNVASSTEVTAIQNNTRVVRVVPESIERPDSGSTTYRVEVLLYDAVGNMEAPDSAPTITLVNQSGTDRSSRLDSTTMNLVSTGRYRAIYTADVADTLEQLVWTFSVIEGGATRLYGNTSLIVDTTAVDFTAADRTKLDAVHAKLPSRSYLAGTTTNTGAPLEADLPTIGTINTKLGTPASSVSADIAAVKVDTAATALDAAELNDTKITTARAEVLSDWIDGGRLDLILDAILDDTGTSGVVLSAAVMNKIADHVIRRHQASVEASSDGDSLNFRSLYGFVQLAEKSDTTTHPGAITIFKLDGTTELGQLIIDTDAAAEPVVGVV